MTLEKIINKRNSGIYGSERNPPPNPCYRSTYMDLGWYPPNDHTAPLSFHPVQRAFTEHLSKCGMYRDTGLNTAMDPTPWGK